MACRLPRCHLNGDRFAPKDHLGKGDPEVDRIAAVPDENAAGSEYALHLIKGGTVALQVPVLIWNAVKSVAVQLNVGTACGNAGDRAVAAEVFVVVGVEKLNPPAIERSRRPCRLLGANDGVRARKARWALGLGLLQGRIKSHSVDGHLRVQLRQVGLGSLGQAVWGGRRGDAGVL